ncbi:RsmD family RNA methyltransferase [Flavitalea sp. BT771]|uniref:RsmD family RNA methyltransferase n=1 Tax=Flavitalea sp. BT771 TaxID=3063329 RepID=UPI0026E263BA|nr:RsmD family RNA methyltransferase [Flavitalea sp. BT771]MDO6434671.1 RsmD family RNA methyltransferase [Flavitalea sp. BT771]MDV6223571.1 RsmD family RNA methyltransferase [Flavitalea sp. BT771]
MRIIGGELGGRRVHPPARMPFTRPTTDIAKEGLFNILENNLELAGLRTLDLFGGTGSISYELASRGVKDLTVVEKDPAMFSFIRKSVHELGLEPFCKVIRMDVFKYMQECTEQFDFIFAGPPYALATIDELPRLVVEKKLLREKGWFVLEHTPRNNYEAYPLFVTQRNYGTTIFSIFVNKL